MRDGSGFQKFIFLISRDLLKRFDETAAQLFMSRSEFIRQAVREKIERADRECLGAKLRRNEVMNELRARGVYP